MTYKIVTEPRAWIEVEWRGLDEDGFEQTHTIDMKAKFLPLSEMARTLTAEGAEEVGDWAKRIALDWGKILGEDGKKFPFSHENLDRMLEHTPGFALGLQLSYGRAWQGQGKVREKNSAASPAGGQVGAEPSEALQASPTS